jgi:hypothetical protein
MARKIENFMEPGIVYCAYSVFADEQNAADKMMAEWLEMKQRNFQNDSEQRSAMAALFPFAIHDENCF